MVKIASKMQLKAGQAAEYKKRHNPIWPELAALLRKSGISDYSIFLDPETNILFAIFSAEDPAALEVLKADELMKKWWRHMKDIMATNEDASPVSIPLDEMFFLP